MEKINSALISVYNKEGIDKIATLLVKYGIKIYSTGGTAKYLKERLIPITEIEDVTSYPSILGGRVKTLHPKVFGGILARRDNESDKKDIEKYELPLIDLIIVDLYPFEETVASGASESEIIEKIDIGGISLIRAAAKNFYHTWIVSHKGQYDEVIDVLEKYEGFTNKEIRKKFAIEAFNVSSHYDIQIYKYFNDNPFDAFKQSILESKSLRYGENPHQKAVFWGNFKEMFTQLHGKEISYNNILDIDAAVGLINDFPEEPTIAILKHNNACGLASRKDLKQAWVDALAGDPLSAFGGIIIVNRQLTEDVAVEMNKIFFEVVIAPSYTDKALEILKQKKNRIILVQNKFDLPKYIYRTALNGVMFQERDSKVEP
jgi:phosphoribosylaminoimidazolecarboxamide formyltransferase/IMP cyclohydrolase